MPLKVRFFLRRVFARRFFRQPALIAASALLAAAPAPGQIEVGLDIAPVRALLYEPVQAAVVIRNNTGEMLCFDAGPVSARFFFDIELNKHEPVRLLDRRPLLAGLKLVPAGCATNVFSLTSLYAMQARGVYKIRACLEWNNVLLVSPAVELEMLKGFEIARLIAGVPGENGATRIYILEYLPQEHGEQLYLRIEDSDAAAVYGMHRLGHIVRVRKPEMKTDESGNLHVLFQTMSMVFIHTAFTPYGVQLFSREYVDRTGKIGLHNLSNGRISVSPLPPEGTSAGGSAALSNAVAPAAPKPRLGRGGLFGPK
jgi:hypothetical protein